MKQPELTDMVIFRENTEDIYAGIEYAGGTPQSQKVLDFLRQEFPKEFEQGPLRHAGEADGWKKQLECIGARRDMPVQVGIGIKPVSQLGTERLVHGAIGYAIKTTARA